MAKADKKMIGKRRHKAKYKKRYEKVSAYFDTVQAANKINLEEIKKLDR